MEIQQPIQAEVVAKMNALGRVIDEIMNDTKGTKQWGFALLVFPFAKEIESRMNYLSNAERDDMIVAMKEFISRYEGGYVEMKAGLKQ